MSYIHETKKSSQSLLTAMSGNIYELLEKKIKNASKVMYDFHDVLNVFKNHLDVVLRDMI